MNRDIPAAGPGETIGAAVPAEAAGPVEAVVSAEASGASASSGAEGAGGGGQRGRPRSQEADRAILTAAVDLLASRGLAAMSIEEVAARAGVGKTTIYRRWSSKGLLALDAFVTSFQEQQPLPDTESLRRGRIAALTAWARSGTPTSTG